MYISWRVRRPVPCIADVLRDLKKESSTWAKENFGRSFTWQEGYAAFTVSPTATDSVGRYIATQQTHHRKHSFVDELRELLNAAGIKFDEKYPL
jgi:putative transposase